MEGMLRYDHMTISMFPFFVIKKLVFRNLIDAANIAALSALSTFRRPECTVSEDDGQEVTIHPPEVC